MSGAPNNGLPSLKIGDGLIAAKSAGQMILHSSPSPSAVVGVLNEGVKTTSKFKRGIKWISQKLKNIKKVSAEEVQVAQTATKTEKFMKFVSKPSFYVFVFVDVVRVGISVKNDIGNRSTRNTVVKVAVVVGERGLGSAAGAIGGAVGTFFCPGIGTAVGGAIGVVIGAVGGGRGTKFIANKISDELQYGIEIVTCSGCQKMFECRFFKTGRTTLCETCQTGRAIQPIDP